MITIIDYGSGNINALTNIYDSLKIPYDIATKPAQLENAERIILPGVGSFDHCMNNLNQSGLKEVLNKKALVDKTPILGICIGLHIMAEKSDEGKLLGLGWVKGTVKKFDKNVIIHKPKIPHMGWNTVQIINKANLFSGVNMDKGFYFIHSYYMDLSNSDDIMTTTEYGNTFVSGINRTNIYGVQFHPEKSHSNGSTLLKNFTKI
tara:strand:+ start:13090 stop:13704 length:615 start_codon:yes stop_codon:yes gene_type:complete